MEDKCWNTKVHIFYQKALGVFMISGHFLNRLETVAFFF